MFSDKDFYLCKNLLYWDSIETEGYYCTITCKKCSCEGTELQCISYERDQEE